MDSTCSPYCHTDQREMRPHCEASLLTEAPQELSFSKVTPEAMRQIRELLLYDRGRTTDFSYGGILMWVDYFSYEYAIVNHTLFIKGTLEDDRDVPAFSLPIGPMPLADSLQMIRDYCRREGIPAELSAVPEYALRELDRIGYASKTELTDWGDYLYDASSLATLTGKKMSKKRNHVNRFMAEYPDHQFLPVTPLDIHDLNAFMDEFSLTAPTSDSAVAERALTRAMVKYLCDGDSNLLGYKLVVNGRIAAFTIGDIKHDTLYVHIEKANREVEGSYEAVNMLFAKEITEHFPQIRYINREDDAGEEGLRRAKLSYHPLEVLRKYNIVL